MKNTHKCSNFQVFGVYRIFTARKRSLGQGNIFRSVSRILSTGGSLPQCMLGYPWEETLPPQRRHPPNAEHAGRYGQRAGGTHPTGMQSCSIFNQTSSGSNLTSLKIIFCVLLADNSQNFRQKTW